MLLSCVCVLAGAYSLVLFRHLPPDNVFFFCLFAGICGLGKRATQPFAWYLLGFVVMGWAASAQLDDRIDHSLVGQTLTFSARIDSFAVYEGTTASFIVAPIEQTALPRAVRLSWFEPDALPQLGETWRFSARLKRPRGYANPGGFDFAAWLFREGIGASGYIETPGTNYRLHGEPKPVIDSLRVHIVSRIADLLPAGGATSVVLAITVGARHTISAEAWDLYARTGTSHLMAISGLHIGLAAACTYWLCRGLLGLCGREWNCRDVALLAAMLIAAAYAILSGFGVPAQRALLMTCLGGVALLFRRRLRPGALIALPCLAIFVANPLAILLPGFGLSFAAVLILLLIAQRHTRAWFVVPTRRLNTALIAIASLVNLQLALLCGLFPLTVLLFNRVSVVAPLINTLALPIFNLVAVPLALTGVSLDGVLAACGDVLLTGAHHAIELVLSGLAVADTLPFAHRQTRHLSLLAALCLFLPLYFVVMPPGWPARRVSFIAAVTILLYRPTGPDPGCLEVQVLDVGQGLAVVLRSASESLLFDTGPAFRTGGDSARLAVLPFLHGQGIESLDRLIVSHADLDHAGGVGSIVAGIPVRRLLVGEPLQGVGMTQMQCVAGMGWFVDNVSFSILHPRIRAPWRRNNASCILEVSVGEHRVLLTGDIEAPVEKLLRYRGAFRDSTIVVVPHHGSRTSSTEALVQSTTPEIAIVTTGYANRWSFPKAEVVARWQMAGATVVNTAEAGAVGLELCTGKARGPIRRERMESLRFWQDVP